MDNKIPEISDEQLKQAQKIANVDAVKPNVKDYTKEIESEDFENMSILTGQINSTDSNVMDK